MQLHLAAMGLAPRAAVPAWKWRSRARCANARKAAVLANAEFALPIGINAQPMRRGTTGRSGSHTPKVWQQQVDWHFEAVPG